jgi:hypothetical protein
VIASIAKDLLMMETKNMQPAKAFYDDVARFPIETPDSPKRKEVNLTVGEEEWINPKVFKKLPLLAVINGNLERLNKTEPLPPEFDEILARRMNFSRTLDP